MEQKVEPKVTSYVSDLVPKETDEEIIQTLQEEGEENALWLFQKIHVKSADVGFSWGTDMLMSRILSWAEEAETEAEFVQSLKYFHQSDELYKKCEPYVHEIFEKYHVA